MDALRKKDVQREEQNQKLLHSSVLRTTVQREVQSKEENQQEEVCEEM